MILQKTLYLNIKIVCYFKATLSLTAACLRSTKMLKVVVAAAVMLHVVASKPMDVDVEVTVNGVKIPINNLPPKTGGYGTWDKSKEPKTTGLMYGWGPDKGNRAEQAKSGGYGTWRL